MRAVHWRRRCGTSRLSAYRARVERAHETGERSMSLQFDTRAVRAHVRHGPNQPLSQRIVLATTYAAGTAANHRDLFLTGATTFYRRFGNPTAAAAARVIADLEGAEDAIVFGSGMGAISSALFAVLRAGDHVVASREIFAQTHVLLDTVLRGYSVETDFVDERDTATIAAHIRPSTKLIYLETPSNPLLHI